MRIREGESYESWCERVRMFEHGWAMQEIAKGQPIEETLEKMAKRITDKLMHPIFTAIRNAPVEYDAEASRKSYEEKYLKERAPVADHVDGQIFDKDQ